MRALAGMKRLGTSLTILGLELSSASLLHAQVPGLAALHVATAQGQIQGVATETGAAYLGVPYAAPPVGELRWRSPAPPRAWAGVKQADHYGPPCAQAPLRGQTAVSSISSEDCLTLNIWVPHVSADPKLPVMVWVHGGGFQNGMGSSPTYDGVALSRHGVIVVTLNYRLAAFGFFAHPQLTADSLHKSSGNFGLEDQIAALRWVAANIAQFGGDPANVTLFGQSAGGASVLDLVTSDVTDGLFARAIIQSGAARSSIAPINLADAEREGESFANGLPLSALRGLDTATVIQMAQAAGRSGARFSPVQDGYIITRAATDAISDQRRKPIPLLIGSNAREGLAVLPPDKLDAAMASAFGANAAAARAAYGLSAAMPPALDRLMGTVAEQFSTDSSFRCGAVQIAAASARAGGPVWHYQFEQFVPGREARGAAHSFEVPYVFGNLLTTGFSAADYKAADRRLSVLMVEYWTNFAKTGNPNGAKLPVWPVYQKDRRAYARFSSDHPGAVELGTDLRGEICRLFP
ncbi:MULTISPECIES: carboxylesterase/lipase family protein [Sphingobium]|uniref:carboxylesterase/lipase family protein n=1 Tax=Sphingobium TaxID=165695 RepID=UPI0015EBBA22|nr:MULTISPECIES: carboxylesterase family protein [Sphingobium]MCW2363003.1 para-nitrobenzyl esterase [Sphingobium sp. B10D3B]MCW2400317.1 para-nitrobenzyl esterase [Sphingobium sp. B10D7B]MCW2407295.1 para-nitrobenzyl esterase [Sphingobium xanthum]